MKITLVRPTVLFVVKVKRQLDDTVVTVGHTSSSQSCEGSVHRIGLGYSIPFGY